MFENIVEQTNLHFLRYNVLIEGCLQQRSKPENIECLPIEILFGVNLFSQRWTNYLRKYLFLFSLSIETRLPSKVVSH